MKKVLLILALLFAPLARAQSFTAVSGTATDVNTTPYASGSLNISFVNTAGQQALFGGNAGFQQTYSAQLDSTGSFTISLPSNTVITPGGTQWKFNICASDGGSCFSSSITITGSSQSISATLSAASPRITFIVGEKNQPACGAGQVLVAVGTLFGCGVAPTATTATNLTGPGAITGTFSGNPTLTGTATFTGPFVCKSLADIRCVDVINRQGWAGANGGAWIASAIADCASDSECSEVFVEPGTYPTTTCISGFKNLMYVHSSSFASATIRLDSDIDGFCPASLQQNIRIEDFQIITNTGVTLTSNHAAVHYLNSPRPVVKNMLISTEATAGGCLLLENTGVAGNANFGMWDGVFENITCQRTTPNQGTADSNLGHFGVYCKGQSSGTNPDCSMNLFNRVWVENHGVAIQFDFANSNTITRAHLLLNSINFKCVSCKDNFIIARLNQFRNSGSPVSGTNEHYNLDSGSSDNTLFWKLESPVTKGTDSGTRNSLLLGATDAWNFGGIFRVSTNGSAASPSHSFVSFPSYGIFMDSNNGVATAQGGVETFTTCTQGLCSKSDQQLTWNSGAFSGVATPDTGLKRSAAGVVALTNGGAGSGSIAPGTAGGGDLGTTSLPFGNLWLGTAATNNFKFQPAATAAARIIQIADPGATSGLFLGGTNLTVSPTAPTIAGAGCGGSAASIVAPNGTAAFKINVGTTPGSACTITMPAATTGWNCFATDITTNSTSVFLQKQTGAESTTSVTITNFSDVAAATAFVASDILKVSCHAD